MYYIVYASGQREGPFDLDGAIARLKAVHHTAATKEDGDEMEYFEPGGKEPVAKIVSIDDIDTQPKE